MGLIKAALGSAGGALADTWKEFFTCDALTSDVLVARGQKQTSKRSSNTHGHDNVITNGSGIAVADGQCVIITDQGKIVEVCAEPGQYTYDMSSEPSVFCGNLGQGLRNTFDIIGKRFTYGGDTAKDQRVYYVNTKEIMDNKFGTPVPFMFSVVNKTLGYERTVSVRCNGTYTYKITNPLLFYTNVCSNVASEYTRAEIDGQLKTEFISALQPAFAQLSELELKPAQIPGHQKEMKDALNSELAKEWTETRGITVCNIAMNPITLTDEDLKKIQDMEDAVAYGSNARMIAGRMASSTATAMEAAANNPGGAMAGFMGMNMAGNAGGGFGAIQNMYNVGQAQQSQQAPADGWTCSCGTVNTGKFCNECGKAKPESDKWVCSCGTANTGKFCSECGKAKPADDKWTCSCGTVNTGKFCNECGKPRS